MPVANEVHSPPWSPTGAWNRNPQDGRLVRSRSLRTTPERRTHQRRDIGRCSRPGMPDEELDGARVFSPPTDERDLGAAQGMGSTDRPTRPDGLGPVVTRTGVPTDAGVVSNHGRPRGHGSQGPPPHRAGQPIGISRVWSVSLPARNQVRERSLRQRPRSISALPSRKMAACANVATLTRAASRGAAGRRYLAPSPRKRAHLPAPPAATGGTGRCRSGAPGYSPAWTGRGRHAGPRRQMRKTIAACRCRLAEAPRRQKLQCVGVVIIGQSPGPAGSGRFRPRCRGDRAASRRPGRHAGHSTACLRPDRHRRS